MNVHRIVNSVFNSCTYIVYDKKSQQAIIVDCGDVDPIIEYVDKNGLQLQYVLLTHSHFDHIYGINDIIKKYPSVKIVTNDNGLNSLRDPKLNLSHYCCECDDIIFNGLEDSIIIHSGDSNHTLSKLGIEIFSTPGHDPSCLTYLIGDYLFTGDSYIPGVKTITHLPNGNKLLAIASEKIIKDIANERCLSLCPGH